MTSEALTDILCARSATVMVSGTETSRMICSAGIADLVFALVATLAAPALRTAPSRRTAGIAAGLERALLGGILGPARSELARLDLLDAAALLVVLLDLARLGVGLGGRLVQGAFRAGRLEHLLRGGHHRLDRRDLRFDLATGAVLRQARFIGGLDGCRLLGVSARPVGLGCNRLRFDRDSLRFRLGSRFLLALLLFHQIALCALGALARFRHLACDQLGGTARLFFTLGALRGVDDRDRGLRGRRFGLGRGALVALHEDALLAHLDLDRARLAGAVGLLDRRRLLARDRDLLLLDAVAGAMGAPQRIEQASLVFLAEVVAVGRLAHAGSAQLLEQPIGREMQLRRKLGHCSACHILCFPSYSLRGRR